MTGRAITIAQQKGGSGKTTLAAHLAVAWACSGRRVATVDIDPQGSLTRWAGIRAEAGTIPAITHAQLTGWRVQREVERLLGDHDVVVIDSPPHAETDAKIAVRAANLVVVPVQPSPMDVWAVSPTLALAAAEGRKVLLVLNRVPPRNRLTDSVLAEIDKLGIAVAQSQIGNRTGFAATMLDGFGIAERGRSQAAIEVNALAAEIDGMIV